MGQIGQVTAEEYQQFRGKCRELCDQAITADPTLTLVRGHYHCWFWGKQEHWWTIRPDGSIHDPSKEQFPSKGLGEYEEFDGWVSCAECGKPMREEGVGSAEGYYAFCSGQCHGRFVGVFT